ncbi:ribosomal-protein-alanine N-acetyltransferase [Novosphingobium capsulatum]|uniref:Ribosomal-protein-alanine N-acetyltransferase n=1 Tax=Novosphingobium capsulatum TaxID=13688 RepID=A0ABU1MJ96_9SPHN|nr:MULTISPECIES: GNAT family N-acetyltransferase [Novosphingobium]MDR6510386.1 ribosomal-protein-alanine N-acetyltransferase [Novosphingobium capsulatum]
MEQIEDLDRIMAVMTTAFPPDYGEAWNRRQVGDALLIGRTRYGLIGADGGEHPQDLASTAGFFLSRSIFDEEELLLFAVAPQYRRQGLGDSLLARFIAQARSFGMGRLFLEMREGNPAGNLYRKHGFQPIGIRPGYYRSTTGERIAAISQELKL